MVYDSASVLRDPDPESRFCAHACHTSTYSEQARKNKATTVRFVHVAGMTKCRYKFAHPAFKYSSIQ